MQFFLQQGGVETGPHAIEALDGMISSGRAQPGDRVRPANSDAWLTVEEFVQFRKYGPKDESAADAPVQFVKPTELPPPLPQDFPQHDPLRPVPLIGKERIRGTEKMTVRELEDLIGRGARVTIFRYCISVLVLTFRRPSAITLLRPGESGFGPAFKYSMISLVAGWWGIPWGPIHTVGSLYTNARGGTDLTGPLLHDLVGQAEAERILAARTPPARGGGFKAVALATALTVLLGWLAISSIDYAKEKAETTVASGPGAAAFIAASAGLRKGGPAGRGNDEQATAVASGVSGLMSAMHSTFFKSRSGAAPKFRTFGEHHGDRWAFLVFVPSLERYDEEGREALGKLAWIAIQNRLREEHVAAGEVALGVRGFSGYDRVLLGHLEREGESFNAATPATTVGAEAREALVPFFVERR